jgi:periplasmic protein TonB
MSNRPPEAVEIFSPREIARAAGSSTADAEALVAAGAVSTLDGLYVGQDEAVRAVLMLRGQDPGPTPQAPLFRPPAHGRRRRGIPLTTAGLVHVTALGIALLATFGAARRADVEPESKPARLVFLVKPGPGGGGGGGGLRQPAPARPALLAGRSTFKSPVPVERVIRREKPDPPARPKPVPPPEVKPAERPVEPPPPVAKPDPVPPVVAPVASAPAESKDQTGVLTEKPQPSNSQGSGAGGGSGTGRGTGIGEGSGPGIGEGSGGGTGGGPYRPGSGITPPELVHEVRPDYTEEARRRSLAGEVVLEIVVKSDGRVGAVRIVRGLGAGLDQRAVDAVRQWRFSPARRLGTPVDVMVEVAVEFRMR